MFHLLEHRGLDDGDIWHKNNIGLGNRLLFLASEKSWKERRSEAKIIASTTFLAI